MANLRQTVLFRMDLGFGWGLSAAQIAHLHFEPIREFMFDIMRNQKDPTFVLPSEKRSQDIEEWMLTPYLFIHAVPNLEILEHFRRKAELAKLAYVEWRDTVTLNISATQREDLPNVLVGLTFGPCASDLIRQVIGDLPLLPAKMPE